MNRLLRPALMLAFVGSTARGGTVDYAEDVKPILAKHCVACHGEKRPRGGLRLDTAAAAIKGGKAGAAVVPGKVEESLLIEAVLGEGGIERMPLKRPPLSPAEIDVLRNWIDGGAKFPANEIPTALNETHWAFVKPARPIVPKLPDGSTAENPIDAFIAAKLAPAGLKPSPEADRRTLIRRASLDLIGLPPTPEEVRAFEEDARPDAYDRMVDRLLASKRYGERWARPWLDLARYADSNGYSIDAPRSIWKYRDWVIDALNADQPFDQFVVDQLAGDLRPNASVAQKVATGFHRNTQINQEGGIDVEQFRVEAIVDRVVTTSSVFLGLTMNCAQCHDHKYDPLTQKEFYSLYAFFNGVDDVDLPFGSPDENTLSAKINAEADAFHVDLLKRHPEIVEKERVWETTLSGDFKVNQSPEIKDAFDKTADMRSVGQKRGLIELYLVKAPEYKAELAKIRKIRANEPKFVTTMIVRERAKPRPNYLMIQGDFTRIGETVPLGVPAVLPPIATDTGRTPNRLDLARWLVAPDHPLTARVTVNRMWQTFFGRGIVETENDFGTQGSPPTHPELLDWLALEFQARGWSQKAVHRLIATSKTYRQSSTLRGDLAKVDPDNRLLGRQSRLRLEAELIRDEMLAASGLLSHKIGGPSVFPPQPDGVMSLGQMNRPWVVSKGEDRYRRGLYTYFWRATPHPGLTVFDAPNAGQTCTRRVRSNTPIQALTLLNDEAAFECARTLARRLLREAPGSDSARIDRAFRLCLARGPEPAEAEAVASLVAAETKAGGEGADLRAWTAAARAILNVDEFITRE